MLKGTRSLIIDTISDIPYLVKSKNTNKNKLRIFWTYIRISIKLFTIHRLSKITDENILGLKVSCFDYGTLHFLFREVFLHNLYYFDTKKKDPIIFDCGANMGMATLYFKWLYPDSIIYAFEPDPTTFALLEKNIKQNNFKDVHLVNVALLDKKGVTNFYVDKDNPGWLTMSVLQERLPKDKISVKTMPLSSYVLKEQVDFLKMDVEGAELAVIQDLIKAQKLKSFNEMVIEYHNGIGDHLDFSKFLDLFEKSGLRYRISANAIPLYQKDAFQDINLYAYRAETAIKS